jgi:hypothetical protein
MLEAQQPRLPQYAGRKVKLTLSISIQKDAKRQPVPVDSALATANRFGRLADVKAGP